jgi:ribosome-binding factor A
MANKSINLQRTESLLMELIPEALSELNDERLRSIPITAVDCKNGKYDATVYFDGSDYTPEERKAIAQLLERANGILKSYILSATNWYKCPNFKFVHDDTLENSARLEELFAQIKKD